MSRFTYPKYILLLLILPLVFASCRKDEADDPDDDHTHGTHLSSGDVSIHLHHMVGTEAFALNQNYTDDFGNVYSFSRAEFYISQPEIQDMNHNVVATFSDSYNLINANTDVYFLGTMEEGHLHSLGINIGVDSAVNHLDPASYASTHALTLQNPSMHWGWNPGYKFIVLEGMFDSDADGTPDAPFVFHVGANSNYRAHDHLDVHADLPHDGDVEIHLNLDYGKFFTGINLTTDNDTHTMDNPTLATQVADNAINLFSPM